MSPITRKALIFIGMVVALSHSYTGAKEIVVPSGEKGFSIRCDEGINACYELAGEICQEGYSIIVTNTQQGFEADGGSSAAVNPLVGYQSTSNYKAHSVADNGLLVQCKDWESASARWRARKKSLQAQRESEERQHDINVAIILGGIMLAMAATISIVVMNQ